MERSFYHAGPRDLNQIFSLGGKHLYPLRYLASLESFILHVYGGSDGSSGGICVNVCLFSCV